MATREAVMERAVELFVQQLGEKPVNIVEGANIAEDLDADSLDRVELVMEIEDQFDIKISDEDAQKIETVGQAVDYVLAHADPAKLDSVLSTPYDPKPDKDKKKETAADAETEPVEEPASA